MGWFSNGSAVDGPKPVAHLDIGGEAVPLTVRVNPRARRLIVRVEPVSGEVVVVAPSQRAVKSALAFAEQQLPWIAKARAQVPPSKPFLPDTEFPFQGETHRIRHLENARRGVWREADERLICVSGAVDHVPRRVSDWLKREARAALSERAHFHAAKLERRPRRISIRDTSSRWGSCTEGGALSFSWRLILAPWEVLDYVAAHEAAHLVHMNHGPRFQETLRGLVPDVKGPERWLHRQGAELHRYGPIR